MGSPSRNRNPFPSSSTRGPHHQSFTRTHQIGALVLVAITFVLTRSFDRLSCSITSPSSSVSSSVHLLDRRSNGGFSWPDRGFGSHLDLNIYVYDESEIDGLRELMRGRDGKISADACLKGQWGTQMLKSCYGMD